MRYLKHMTPTMSICSSTTPASAVAVRSSPIAGKHGTAASTSASTACDGGHWLSSTALAKSDEGHIVNTSSVNGFWASIGADRPHTAYSAAKFAVKGFTEALITDLAVNAPHVSASVVMPGHIGTNIVASSMNYGSRDLTDEERELGKLADQMFHDMAPMTASEAATVILTGVRENRWRILVGDDAHKLDNAVRANPEAAYEPGFGDMLFGELRGAADTMNGD